MEYEWKNKETGEIVLHDHWSVAPDLSGTWERKFSFGLSHVQGAGGSPSRPTVSEPKDG